MVATRRLYWTERKDALVGEGEGGASLAFPVGAEIPKDIADRYGLSRPAAPPVPEPDLRIELEDELVEPKAEEPPENKALEAAPNKARRRKAREE